MNRFAAKLDEIRTKCDALDEQARVDFEREMDVSFQEHFSYQQLQAECHALGVISTEEAQLIYIALGEVGSTTNGGWAAGTDLPTKVLVTLVVGELLTLRRRALLRERAKAVNS